MKASRFSDAQKAFILKQGADGVPVADISVPPPVT
jgi:putative transposase